MIYQFNKYLKPLICISSIFLSLLTYGQVCDFHGNVIEIEDQETIQTFGTNSTLEYINQVLTINGSEMKVKNLEGYDFKSRIELESYLGCSFPVSKDFYSTCRGNIKTFDLDDLTNGNNIQKLDYITFNQYDREFKFVLVNQTYLFEFVNTVTYISKPATYYEESEILAESYEYIPQTEISGEFIVLAEAEYENVTEQVLVSDGYAELSEIPAQFQEAYHYFYNETSDCQNAVVESESVSFIKKEAYFTLDIVDAKLETLTEQILDVHAYFGPTYYEREPINLDTLKQIYVKRIQIESMKENCYNLNFIRCAKLTEITDSTLSISEIGFAYLPCPSEYKSAGEYCFNEEIEVPATYKQRDYLKLIKPATTNTLAVAAEFTSVSLTKVKNKNELNKSCVTVKLDSVAYLKLLVPASVKVLEIPAMYGTITHKLLTEYPEFEAIESQEESENIMIDAAQNIKKIEHQLKIQSVDLTCMHETIKNRLIELSFVNTNVELYSKEYYQSIIEYQQAFNLPIGAIDAKLLESLNISFE